MWYKCFFVYGRYFLDVGAGDVPNECFGFHNEIFFAIFIMNKLDLLIIIFM